MFLIDNRNSADPYINLAIEEYLIRNADCNGKEYLLLYINEPCIVLGKNQSIYKEVNFEYLRNGQLKLARRISGGGTVYQDPGNLSFSFISKFSDAKVNNYRYFNRPVVEALIKAGIPAEMDARNNILCNGKKISGNAQFTDRKNIISHGTLLFSADLTHLRGALKENDFTVETRAVSSVRSSVMNIMEATDKFESCIDLRNYIATELDAKEVYRFNDEEWSAIEKLAADKFDTFEWVYGKSPSTKIVKQDVEIEVENGIILEARHKTRDERHKTEETRQEQFTTLKGKRYEFKELKTELGIDIALQLM